MSATDREDAILAALRAARGAPVSGTVLAAGLGVSRVAVGKRIAALRRRGYVIEARAGTGYALCAPPDLPLPSEVGPLLRSTTWTRLTGGGATGSTNDDAKALARAGAAEGTVVLASEQTRGRGRLGREWSSPVGGVYLSALLRPALAPAEISPLPLVAGVGVARAFASLGATVRLKWPNDVYCRDGRKLAGILVEMAAESDRIQWTVVGIGVNVRRAGGATEGGACYLEETVPSVRVAEVAAAVLDALSHAYGEFIRDGFAGRLRDEYEERSWLDGREVTVSDPNGVSRVTGRVAGVDETGRLVVEDSGRRVAVAAGEVTLRGDAE